MKTEPDISRNTHWVIVFLWLVTVPPVALMSGLIAGELLGMSVTSPVNTTITAFGFSIFHPGGWLGLAGLLTAFIKQKKRWLWLSTIGAILTGITIPILEGIGGSML